MTLNNIKLNETIYCGDFYVDRHYNNCNLKPIVTKKRQSYLSPDRFLILQFSKSYYTIFIFAMLYTYYNFIKTAYLTNEIT